MSAVLTVDRPRPSDVGRAGVQVDQPAPTPIRVECAACSREGSWRPGSPVVAHGSRHCVVRGGAA